MCESQSVQLIRSLKIVTKYLNLNLLYINIFVLFKPNKILQDAKTTLNLIKKIKCSSKVKISLHLKNKINILWSSETLLTS